MFLCVIWLNCGVFPKLRSIQFRPVSHEGQQYFLLDDPFKLSDEQLFLPHALARIATLCDGTRSAAQLHEALAADAPYPPPPNIVDDMIEGLDKMFLLDNERAAEAINEALASYRDQPFRPPLFAGQSYPDSPDDLDEFLASYSTDDDGLADWEMSDLSDKTWRGLISPHIDYQRGGHVYAKVWERARGAIEAADIILIFATDHHGGHASLTLSSLPYATPYGVVPTDGAVVGRLSDVLGGDAYALELNHLQEHSIELVTTWLHYVRRDLCPVVPILVGSFYHFTPDGHPMEDEQIARFMAALREATAGKNVFCVASVDLAHVGPAFDSAYKMDDVRREALAAVDEQLQQAIVDGDAESWYQQLAEIRNENNVCGFSPTYLMLKFMGETAGHKIAYAQCPADAQNTSTVSICGMLLA